MAQVLWVLATQILAASAFTIGLSVGGASKDHGGIPAKMLRTLRIASEPQTVMRITTLNAGAVLVREWNGRTYQVSVLEEGFRMDGKDYTSLTAIAKKIAGAKWSGPRFFGLTGKRGVKHA